MARVRVGPGRMTSSAAFEGHPPYISQTNACLQDADNMAESQHRNIVIVGESGPFAGDISTDSKQEVELLGAQQLTS